MELEINSSARYGIDAKALMKIARLVGGRKSLVSLSFVTGAAMKKLNRKYRGKNRPTDVLSFNMDEGRLLGDVVICPQVAKANAKRFGVTLREEIARLLVHGLLHLTGLNHGKKMFDRQDRIMRRLGYA